MNNDIFRPNDQPSCDCHSCTQARRPLMERQLDAVVDNSKVLVLQAADALAKAAKVLNDIALERCTFHRKDSDPKALFDFTDLGNALAAYEKVRLRQ